MPQDVENALKTLPVADYMKIRQYVVSLVEKGAAGPIMIPSMNELAHSFGVTRMTVHKALKDLIKDGYLIVRKGIGTFANASSNPPESVRQKFTLGIVVGNAKHCFYGVFYWDLMMLIGHEAALQRCKIRPLNLFESAPDKMLKEIKDNWVDAVAWISPDDTAAQTIKALHDSGFPVVSVQRTIPGVNSVSADWEGHTFKICKGFLAEGRSNILFAGLLDPDNFHGQFAGIKRAYAEAGLKFNERMIWKDERTIAEELENVLSLGIRPQAAYLCCPCANIVVEALKRHGIDIQSECRIIAEPFYIDEVKDFSGLVREYRFEEEAKICVEMLDRMFSKHDFSVESKLVEFKVKRLNLKQQERSA